LQRAEATIQRLNAALTHQKCWQIPASKILAARSSDRPNTPSASITIQAGRAGKEYARTEITSDDIQELLVDYRLDRAPVLSAKGSQLITLK
jgi:hypothetical protein